MPPPDLALWRLNSMQILRPTLRQPGEVVHHLCAIQAQDFAGALWSVGLRMPAAARNDIRVAIDSRTIVRTWLLRGTLHFVAPEDIRWILGLVAPRIIAGSAGRHRQLGLSEGDFARSRELFFKELQGGKHLTRDEIFALLVRAGIPPDGQRGYHLLWMAGLAGLICFGSPRGNQPTFVLLNEWVPKHRDPGREKALAWLAVRYFTGHGPATLQDYIWWSGLKVADAKAGIEGAGSRISSLKVKGTEYFTGNPVPDLVPGEPAAYLLPGFDEFILGYRDRSVVLDPSVTRRTVIGGNGMLLPTLVIDGSVAGTWKRTVKKQGMTIELHPFLAISPAHKRLVQAAAERYGMFMGTPAVVEW